VYSSPEGNGASINLSVKPLGYSHCDCVKLLLKNHADANCTNTEQELLISVALQEQHYSIILLLLQHGAIPPASLRNIADRLLKDAELEHGKVILSLIDRNFINLTLESTFLAAFDFAFKRGSVLLAERILLNDSYSKIEQLYPEVVYYSAKNNWPDILLNLIEKGVDINSLTKGQTPIYVSCAEGHENIVNLLLNNGADPNFPSKLRKLADSNYRSLPLEIAVRRGNPMIVRMLLEKGAEVTRPIESLLHVACTGAAKLETGGKDAESRSEGHMSSIVRLLLQHGSNVNTLSDVGDTALYRACINQHLVVVQVLLEAGADVNLTSKNLYPLTAACDAGNAELISLLVKAGADVECKEGLPDKSTLLVACLMQNKELVDTILQHGANPNLASSCDSHSKHRLPLFVAVDKGNAGIITSLISAGASVNVTNNEGKSVVCFAVENMLRSNRSNSRYHCAEVMVKKLSMIHLLVQHGANLNMDGCTIMNSAVTALADLHGRRAHYGTRYVVELLQLMVKGGAVLQDSFCLPENISYNPFRSWTLLFLAKFDGSYQFIVDLFRAGAGFQLIAQCCNAVMTGFWKEKSFSLCQAAVLAGHVPSDEELRQLQLEATCDDVSLSENDSDTDSENASAYLFQQLVIWLNEDRQRVPSLLRQCRVVIRRQLSVAVHFQSILPAIDKLPLPDIVKQYLQFDGPLTEVDLTVNNDLQACESSEVSSLSSICASPREDSSIYGSPSPYNIESSDDDSLFVFDFDCS